MAEALTTVEQETAYTTKDVIRLFTASYKHSRGNGDLQDDIFRFLASNYGERLTPELVDATLPAFMDVAGHYIYRSGQHPPLGPRFVFGSSSDDIEDEVRGRGETLKFYMRGGAEPRNPWDTVNALILVDHAQIPYTREDSSYHYSMQPTKYRSNFIHYGFLKHSTGLDEFDLFYSEAIKDYWNLSERGCLIEGTQEILQTVVSAHLVYNPAEASLLKPAVAK